MSKKPDALADFPAELIAVPTEDYERLKQFATERGVTDLKDVVGVLLDEYARLTDLVWEAKLARPIPDHRTELDDLLDQVQSNSDAGLTEDLTPDLFNR